MRVYLAAPYAARDALRPLADELSIIGMEVTSRWLTEDHDLKTAGGAATSIDAETVRQHCHHDFADIDKAGVLVLFTAAAARELIGDDAPGADRLHSGGRHVETGYAIAKGKRVIVIGEPECIFHRGACKVVPDWHAAVLALCAMERQRDYRQVAVAAS